MNVKRLALAVCLLLASLLCRAQITDGVTGLLHMPSGDMEQAGTFKMGMTWLDVHNLPNEGMNKGNGSLNYYFNIAAFDWLEMAYIGTVIQGFRQEDRHVSLRVRPLKEGKWWPSVVLGWVDPMSGDYSKPFQLSSKPGNAYFNRIYIAASKHLDTGAGTVGVHAAYLYNRRPDYPLNGPAFGLDYRPSFARWLDVIAEYDGKTVNAGLKADVWRLRFGVELQGGRYLSAGFQYRYQIPF